VQVARTLCRGQLGLHAPLVQVEVNLGHGLPSFSIVGLPEAAVRESKQRVRAALENCGFEFPAGRITVNLAPADLPKEGGRFDLPIALGILLASGQLIASPGERAASSRPANGADREAPREFYGELGLDGSLKPVGGLLLAAAHAARAHHPILVPRSNAAEASLVMGERGMRAAGHLLEACAVVRGEPAASLAPSTSFAPYAPREVQRSVPLPSDSTIAPLDLSDVRGQHQAKRALIVAAAGSHSLLLSGPPGAGKTMLAQRLPGLLPPLEREEALEAAMIAAASASGFEPGSFGRRPFRAPHHTASAHAIIGGGPHVRPGEASLAHRGILFLDELPEFDRRVLEALREPLESGSITVSRARTQATYPAAFQLVAAMNPCPCGYLGDAVSTCRCTPGQIERYRARVSGPLLDRIDLHVAVARVAASDLGARSGLANAAGATNDALDSGSAAARVAEARSRQLERAGRLNRDLSPAELGRLARVAPGARLLLEEAFDRLKLTARSYHRVLRVALTLADLDGSGSIEPAHVAEAVQLRRGL
jgi:magnesium chelatase family protein